MLVKCWLLISAPEFKKGECKLSNSITATANNLQFSVIERRDLRTSFSPITFFGLKISDSWRAWTFWLDKIFSINVKESLIYKGLNNEKWRPEVVKTIYEIKKYWEPFLWYSLLAPLNLKAHLVLTRDKRIFSWYPWKLQTQKSSVLFFRE